MISRLLALMLVALLSACGGEDSADQFIEAVEEGQENLVSLSVSAEETVLDVSSQRQLTATATNASGTTSDFTSRVNWSSSDAAVASVTGSGMVNALAAGTATITASFGSLSDTLDVTVSDADLVTIDVTSAEVSVNECQNIQLAATGNYDDGTQRNLTELVTWSAANSSLGEFISTTGSEGLLRTFDSGSLTTSASYDGQTGSADVTINDSILTMALSPTAFSLENGTSQNFIATASYSNGTTADVSDNAQWSVVDSGSGTGIGSVDNTYPDKGTFTASAVGDILLQVECGQVSTNTSVTVTVVKEVDYIEIENGNSGIIIEDNDQEGTRQLTATAVYTDGSEVDITDDDDIVWSVDSGDSSVISISNASGDEGEVSYTGFGEVVIEARYEPDNQSSFFTDTITVVVRAE